MKLAIIGASTGQVPLCLKAREMGLETICFAWEQGALCRDLVSRFYPISITEKEQILAVCQGEKVDGVVTNASEATIDVVAYLATRLRLHGLNDVVLQRIKNKAETRRLTNEIKGLTPVEFRVYDGSAQTFFPCVVKPVTSSGKRGVSFVGNEKSFDKAVKYALEASASGVLVEKCVDGDEISIEALSYEGKHQVIQITDKQNSGAPHFVEIGHHQPSMLPSPVKDAIRNVVPEILSAIGFTDGPSHIEMRVSKRGDLYLIEVNPRGGGDEISNTLVGLSTDFDYVKGMIDVALGVYTPVDVHDVSCAGIYYLCQQTAHLLPYFENAEQKPWLVKKNISCNKLSAATGNRDRCGYMIYNYSSKITFDYD